LELKFAFYVRGLACFITDMNVHVRLGMGEDPGEGPQALVSVADFTPVFETQPPFLTMH
jgi:hypothetical protein